MINQLRIFYQKNPFRDQLKNLHVIANTFLTNNSQ